MNLYPLLVPAGSDGQIQYNDGNLFGGDSALTWDDGAAKALTIGNCAVLGSDSAVFQPNADSTTFFQIKNAAGASVLTGDSTNRQVIIGQTSATYPLLINSTNGLGQLDIYHDDNDAWFKTMHVGTVGYFKFQSGESDSHTILSVYGNGATKWGRIRLYDQDQAEYLELECASGRGIMGIKGASPVAWSIQENADAEVFFFRFAAAGETPQVSIFGQSATSGSRKNLAIGIEVDADDTASFDGLSNYWFNGAIESEFTAPYLTLHNSTHEDTDGGGESRIIGKREDGAGTETAAGQIEISHDGAGANDQLGKMTLGVNTGAGLVNRMELNATGMEIFSADASDRISIHHDNDNAFFNTTDGDFIFTTDEGTNTNTVVRITGKGTGYGSFRCYDNDQAEYLEATCDFGVGYIRTQGSSPSYLRLQDTAHEHIQCFSSATSGETKELQVFGFRAADVLRSLQIGIGVDAADTASFDGLSNYYFDGNVGIGTTNINAALQMGDDKLIAFDVNAGLTASTTQSQGQGALTAQVNEISTVANNDDTVTLPTAVTGITIEIVNNGANTLQIFPASGDDLGLGVNVAEELEANESVGFVAYDTTNWAKESTTEIIHAEIHDEDNTDAFVINDAGGDFHSYHTNGLAAGDLADWTFDAGGAGTSFPIASIANSVGSPGTQILVTTTGAHGLAVGDIISQTNLADAAYVGVFEVIATAAATTYEVTASYTATGTGTMDQAATLTADAVAAGVYSFAYYVSGTLVGNNETFDFQLYNEATAVIGSKVRRKFGAANDFGSMSGGGVVSIGDGDKISFALSNEDSAANIIIRNLTVVLVRL